MKKLLLLAFLMLSAITFAQSHYSQCNKYDINNKLISSYNVNVTLTLVNNAHQLILSSSEGIFTYDVEKFTKDKTENGTPYLSSFITDTMSNDVYLLQIFINPKYGIRFISEKESLELYN